jgi:hypothetical protein
MSKLACLSRFSHKDIGFTGPLDQALLSFVWMTTSIRVSLRILMEAVLVSMFLSAEAERERADWTVISSR